MGSHPSTSGEGPGERAAAPRPPKSYLLDNKPCPPRRPALPAPEILRTRAPALPYINDPANLGDDLFALALDYDQPQHPDAVPQYNGNISALTAHTATGTNFRRTFTYDGLDRLRSADYYDLAAPANDGRYASSYTYDQRGNLATLNRQGRYAVDQSNHAFATIDQLAYAYTSGTNRLQSVTDGASDPDAAAAGYAAHDRGDYGYHTPTGNMTYDPSRDLTVAYNYLNLPHTFTQGDGSTIAHLYTADGTKLRETTTGQNGTPVSQRDYLGPVIYEDGVPQSIQHADGRVVPGGACASALHVGGGVAGAETYAGGRITTDATVLPTGRLDLRASGEIRLKPGFEVQRGGYLLAETVGCPLPAVGQWQFEYFLTDHLGNNRVLFADSDGDGSIDPATKMRSAIWTSS